MTDLEEIPFVRKVFTVVERIPYGKVTTYGAIARCLGSPRSARGVGFALHSLIHGHDLPAHRVINRNGFLSGGWHFGHPDVMKAMLEDEHVSVSDEYIVDLTRYFWDPADDPALDHLTTPHY
ncbi:MAG: MGMT family protein [Thermomicrobiales bacterium]